MNQDDAFKLLVSWMRKPDYKQYSQYGYDVYLPSLLRSNSEEWCNKNQDLDESLRENIPHFYAAAWDLCRRGILRPGVNHYEAQSTLDGSAGNGYSITPFGAVWLDESDRDDYVPTEPGRFALMLKPYRGRFGQGFYVRSQEAVRCYGAHAYLACCAMCGGACESIILATAIEKENEDKVLKQYVSANGRTKVENMIIGKANDYVKREYRGYTCLIKYWRDESSHGNATTINDEEAYTSLSLLLRFALFVNDNWNSLTSHGD